MQVVDENAPMFPRPPFFSGALLNFAENLLFPTDEVDSNSPAVIAATETTRETITWKELRERVRRCQAGMQAIGIKPGERVAGYVGNHTNALVAMLAATSLGAIWTAISPDSGVHAVLERLRQIEPSMLFADNATFYNGKVHEVLPKIADIVAALPSLRVAAVFRTVPSASIELSALHVENGKAYVYEDLTEMGSASAELHFEQLPADHPVYILYSSGTTVSL